MAQVWMRAIMRWLARYAAAEDGAAASEYALMLLILGGCAATAVHALGEGKTFSFWR